MGHQFKNLREEAIKTLSLSNTIPISDSQPTSNVLFEELSIQQLELALQNIHLIETQTQLEDLVKNYNDLYELTPAGYFTIDVNGLILDVNNNGATILGIKKAALIGKSFTRYISPEFQPVFSDFCKSTFKTKESNWCEVKLLKKDGPLFHSRLKGTILKNDRKEKLLLMIIDFNYQRNEDSHETLSLNNAQNNANELVFAITNELNNPLGIMANYIHGCIKYIEKNTSDTKNILYALNKASEQLNRTSELILRMRNFIFKNEMQIAPACLNTMIYEAIDFLKNELNDFPIDIHYRSHKNISTIYIDKMYLQQAILHLVRNSIDAIRDANITNPNIYIEANQFNKNILEISIHDNGPGISTEISHKLFNPNFTTKHYGTGLGLAMSKKIIEAHGGKLIAELNPMNGACFKLTLPLRDK